jgi:hypothetical protein
MIPIHNSMKEPKYFSFSLFFILGCILILYAGFGFTCYAGLAEVSLYLLCIYIYKYMGLFLIIITIVIIIFLYFLYMNRILQKC